MTSSEMDPYRAPGAPLNEPAIEPIVEQGSIGLGIALGFLLGLWGLIGCILLSKPATKRGAIYGFFGRLGIAAIAVLIAVATG